MLVDTFDDVQKEYNAGEESCRVLNAEIWRGEDVPEIVQENAEGKCAQMSSRAEGSGEDPLRVSLDATYVARKDGGKNRTGRRHTIGLRSIDVYRSGQYWQKTEITGQHPANVSRDATSSNMSEQPSQSTDKAWNANIDGYFQSIAEAEEEVAAIMRSLEEEFEEKERQSHRNLWCEPISQERKVATVCEFYNAFHEAKTLPIQTCTICYRKFAIAELEEFESAQSTVLADLCARYGSQFSCLRCFASGKSVLGCAEYELLCLPNATYFLPGIFPNNVQEQATRVLPHPVRGRQYSNFTDCMDQAEERNEALRLRVRPHTSIDTSNYNVSATGPLGLPFCRSPVGFRDEFQYSNEYEAEGDFGYDGQAAQPSLLARSCERSVSSKLQIELIKSASHSQYFVKVVAGIESYTPLPMLSIS
ncbi:hypothetical protein BKA66DRAFT_599084 [Pyrenochaeta sp. MPI-SDFR-AT-0127]|nr:hypothetical protein BKA66DRAFT_599084 [Pyrenochaeta sp. MPI-SDFR-AT-0127]